MNTTTISGLTQLTGAEARVASAVTHGMTNKETPGSWPSAVTRSRATSPGST
jgi:hypothetical protein